MATGTLESYTPAGGRQRVEDLALAEVGSHPCEPATTPAQDAIEALDRAFRAAKGRTVRIHHVRGDLPSSGSTKART